MRIVLATLAVAGAALIACGGSDKKAVTPAASVATTTPPAPSLTRTAPTSTAVPATAAVADGRAPRRPPRSRPPTAAPPPQRPPPDRPPPPPPPPPPPAGGAITLVAVNILFDTSSLSSAAGPVTVTLDNRDLGIAHNVQFFSKTGSIGVSEIETGPSMQTLPLGPLAPGAYAFKCDVHPLTMTGVLTVS